MQYPYGKQILITGASSGIGKAAAEMFAAKGYTVFAASRRCAEDTQALGGGKLVRVRMDVCAEESVRQAKAKIAEMGGIGIVLHCAGMGIAGAAEDTPEAAIRAQFEVNYFGVLRVNRHFLPLLRARGTGLVLFVGSVAGRVPLPYQSHYSATKYALDTYMESLRMETKALGIRVALIEPGDTNTGFTAARQMAVPTDSPYKAHCESAVARMAKDELGGDPPSKPAKAALRLAQRKSPPPRVTVGLPYKVVLLLRRLIPARLFEAILAKIYQ
jgi:short-subunit dehydrogenase